MKTFEKLKIRPVNVKNLSARSYYREYDPVRLRLDDIRLGDIVYLRGYKGYNNYPWIVVDGITVKNIMSHTSPIKNSKYLITSKSSKHDPYTTRKHNIVLQPLLLYKTFPAYEPIPNDEYDVVRVYVPDEIVRKSNFNNTHEFIEYIDDISDILNYDTVLEKLKIKPVSVNNLKDVKIVVNTLYELQYLISKRILHHGTFCSLNDIDVSHITNMSFLFKDFKEFDGDISDWDVSNVEDMSFMFFCTDFTGKNTDFSKWDISNVRDMRCMFAESKLSANLSSWTIPKDCLIKNMLLHTNLENVSGERFWPKIQS